MKKFSKAIVLFAILVSANPAYAAEAGSLRDDAGSEKNNSGTSHESFSGIMKYDEQLKKWYIEPEVDGDWLRYYPINIDKYEHLKSQGKKVNLSAERCQNSGQHSFFYTFITIIADNLSKFEK